jgi:hypothetical protein
MSKSMQKMGLTEIQKKTIAQRLRDGISIRAIAAEVVLINVVLLAKQKIKPMCTSFFLANDITLNKRKRKKTIYIFWLMCVK